MINRSLCITEQCVILNRANLAHTVFGLGAKSVTAESSVSNKSVFSIAVSKFVKIKRVK